MNDLSESGPNPNDGTVEQKTAETGALMDEAMCKGAESLTKFISAPFIRTADSRKLSWPA
jgi:hypothetical protein